MRRANELDTAFSDRARGKGLEFAPDLVNDDDFGIVIFNGFDHHFMLKHWLAYLHTTRLANSRVRNITITPNFIRCIYNDNAFIFCKDARGLTQERRFAHARSSKNQRGLARLDDILNDIYGAVDSTPDAQRQTNHSAAPIANGRDTMQCALNTRTVIGIKITDTFQNVVELSTRQFLVAQNNFIFHEASSGHTSEV